MQAKYKWLLLPPSIALILFLGPLRNGIGSGSTPSSTAAAKPVSAMTPGSGIPEIPGMDQIISTLVGVLILGVVGIVVLAKLLKPRTNGGKAGLVEHKQTLRVTAKHQVHVLQFDGQMLLLGTCDSNMNILCAGEANDGDADELELTAREREEDEGAVPKDLIIPRPARKRALPAKTLNLRQFNKLLEKARAGQP